MPLFKLKYWLILGMLLPLIMVALALVNPDGPDYAVAEPGDGFELREYAPLKLARTRVSADFGGVQDAAYPALLNYIGGSNSFGRKVPMLAPVMQQQTDDDDWLVSFVMAKEYPMSMLPPPGTDAVVLEQVPERLLAARRFGGGWAEERWRAETQALRLAIEQAGLVPVGEPVLARYNAPFVPGFLRRNEVLWEVER